MELERVHGVRPAETLMSLLPPDWESLATKEDLRVLGIELRGELHKEISQMTRTVVFTVLGAFVGLAGVFATLTGILVAAT